MLESILSYIGSLDPTWIYVVLFFFSFIENVFPPSPSDLVVIVGASLISSTAIGFLPVLLITSIGSALGFILMYYVGFFLSEKILRNRRQKFISQKSLAKIDKWFKKYGYKIILANRFLPGTRSVISFFSGVHELNVKKTFLMALISAFLWNAFIVNLGIVLGNNVARIDYYLTTYSTVIIILTAAVILYFLIRALIKKKLKEKKSY